ncbi:MAG: hypothetical protein H6743_03715 [Rickettsiaceae bacterium]|nr:hypothetical protein [Rickettsiaceae bacterium]
MPYKLNPFTGNFDEIPDLSGYVPYTGATANVDLGAYGLLWGGDTGLFEFSADRLQFKIGGNNRWDVRSTTFSSTLAYGGCLNYNAGTSTVPALTFVDDLNTGIGRSAADSLSFIGGGVSYATITSSLFEITRPFTKVSNSSSTIGYIANNSISGDSIFACSVGNVIKGGIGYDNSDRALNIFFGTSVTQSVISITPIIELKQNTYLQKASIGYFEGQLGKNDATPDVGGANVFITNSTVATTITNFDRHNKSQPLYIIATDSNTTIQHNSNIHCEGFW